MLLFIWSRVESAGKGVVNTRIGFSSACLSIIYLRRESYGVLTLIHVISETHLQFLL